MIFSWYQNAFALLCVKANSKKNWEESFSLLRFKANYLEKKRCYPSFSLWITIALVRIYFFCVILTWRKFFFD